MNGLDRMREIEQRENLAKLKARYLTIDMAPPADGPPDEVTIRIRCSGRIHRVTMRRHGRVTLHDHTKADLRARETLGALGGKPPECLRVMGMVKGRYAEYRRSECEHLYNAAMVRRSARRRDAHARTVTPDAHAVERPLKERIRARVAVRTFLRIEQLLKSNYELQKLNIWRLSGYACANAVTGYGQYGRLPDGNRVEYTMHQPAAYMNSSTLQVRFPLRWGMDVAGRGLALVDGKVVLTVVEDEPNAVLRDQGRAKKYRDVGPVVLAIMETGTGLGGVKARVIHTAAGDRLVML